MIKNNNLFNISIDFTALTTIISAMLYLTGWMYFYNYMLLFNISTSLADVAQANHYIIGLNIVANHKIQVLINLIIFAIILVAINSYQFKYTNYIKFCFYAVYLFYIFSYLSSIGTDSAIEAHKNYQKNNYKGLNNIAISFTKDVNDRMYLERGCYKFIAKNSDSIFILKSFNNSSKNTIVIKNDLIETFELLESAPPKVICG